MEVRVGLVGHVVVDSHVDALNVDTTAENVGGYTDTRLELLELLVALDTVKKLARLQEEYTRVTHTAPPDQYQNGPQC
jgi:hypothetical protein